jgi:lipoate-protein ligase A
VTGVDDFFAVLPFSIDEAAGNMAQDRSLLDWLGSGGQELPAAVLRHYSWTGPAWTFGYSQRWDEACASLPANVGETRLVRRPTGGGVVDHRVDWTYALAVAQGHPLWRARAQESYRAVHSVLAAALTLSGRKAEVAPCEPDKRGAAPALTCFERPEIYDVVEPESGRKLAGAAQKRNRQGLLMQGSIDKKTAGAGVDWERFGAAFAEGLSELVGLQLVPVAAPPDWEERVTPWRERFASPEWNRRR